VFGAAPPQSSEDCLHLDIIIPDKPKSASLPVAVQIHGGGYTLGNSLTFDGTQFTAIANGSIIYVQIQYRLGPYGFLGSEEIRQNGTANAGLLDQRAALEWIQRHTSAFGGDPEKVTIWGGSAGGGSITNQLILYGGNSTPPFRAAIPGISSGHWRRLQLTNVQNIHGGSHSTMTLSSNCNTAIS